MELERNYQDLANAIIKQAAKDWFSAVKRLKKKPWNKDAQRLREETESFFLSEWCYALGGVDGRYIIAKLKEDLS